LSSYGRDDARVGVWRIQGKWLKKGPGGEMGVRKMVAWSVKWQKSGFHGRKVRGPETYWFGDVGRGERGGGEVPSQLPGRSS